MSNAYFHLLARATVDARVCTTHGREVTPDMADLPAAPVALVALVVGVDVRASPCYVHAFGLLCEALTLLIL